MDAAEDKRKHLELIQGVVNRLAGNSFMLKGWALTIVAALVALANRKLAPIGLLPTVGFCLLDGYYLWQEKLFRVLYDQVRVASQTDYSMDTTTLPGRPTYMSKLFSRTILGFYVPLGITVALASWLPF